jgi:hypothetical protein
MPFWLLRHQPLLTLTIPQDWSLCQDEKTAETDNSHLTCPQASAKFKLKSTFQEVLGRKEISTTIILTHVLNREGKSVTIQEEGL